MAEGASKGFSQLNVGTKAEAAYAELRKRILDGRLPPSEVLNQQELASNLGLSITPIREALRRLQAEGFVEAVSNGATKVAPLDAKELKELYEVRVQIDSYAARRAARHATAGQIEALRECAALTSGRPNRAHTQLKRNQQFHEALYKASGNGVLASMCLELWQKTDRYRMVLLEEGIQTQDVYKTVHDEHERIAEAIASKDEEKAAELVMAHTRSAQRYIESSGHVAYGKSAG